MGRATIEAGTMRDIGELPSGIVTFLLADVEGSTRLWESGAESMSASMERLGEIAHEVIMRHGGARPVEQGEGDSFVAAFARASDAVACAADLQRALTSEQWSGPPLSVRIGLHTGEARLRDDGRNYAGESMNRAARLRNLGHGGQTLLSRSTYELVADALPSGSTLRDLGPHHLRDLQRPEHVWQLSVPEQRDDFPPLRSVDAMPNNLPTQLTSFVGRDDEMTQIRELLRDHRVVTLTGSGGVGKTRLAVEVAASVLDAFPDGVWLTDLSSTNSAEIVPSVVATAVHAREIAGRRVSDALVDDLQDAHTLLVLDNCEHLTEACAELVEMLVQRCRHLTVLATSREPLGVAGEFAWRVPSLEVPDATGAVAESEAAKLFRDRATATRPNFAITEANAAAVAEICRRLDGIPLAIELAAARVRVLTPQQIASGLTDRFQFLTGGGPRALARQRTLEASVDWSYNLLSEEERTLLRRLSVFAGGFDLDAAEAVCADEDIDAYRVLDLLASLVDRSLVQMEERGDFARYHLLETIRQYAAQKLVDAGEGNLAGDRHLEFCRDRVVREASIARSFENDLMETFHLADTEHDNVRAAIDWAVAKERTDDALRLCTEMSSYWSQRRLASEGLQRLETALALPGGEPRYRCAALAMASTLSQMVAVERGRQLGEEAVALANELGDPHLIASSLVYLGHNRTFVEPDRARSLFEEAAPIVEELGDPFLLYFTSLWLGYFLLMSGEVPAASERIERAVSIARGAGSGRLGRAYALYFRGVIRSLHGDLDGALDDYEEGRAIAAKFGVDILHQMFLGGLVDLAVMRDEIEHARSLATQLDHLAQRTRLPDPWGQMSRSTLLHAEGDREGARREMDGALRVAEMTGNVFMIALVNVNLAAEAASDGDHPHAHALIDRAFEYGGRSPWALSGAHLMRSHVVRLEGDTPRAEMLAHDALREAVKQDAMLLSLPALDALAGLAALNGRPEEAARLFAATHTIRESKRWRREHGIYVSFALVDWRAADIELTRAALGDEVFESAWAEGAAMSHGEAIAYAQRGRGPRAKSSAGWDALSQREVDVVRLVAQGLTNPEIGEKLFCSKRTVQAHLSRIFTKVGVSSRAELASEATRRGL